MHRFPFEQQVLIDLQSAAIIGLAVRFWWTGLYRIYVYFFGYLLLLVIQSIVLSSVPFRSLAYRDAFLVSEGLIVCSYSLIVLELYSVILRDLHGIASLSRKYIKITLGFAVALSALLIVFEKTPGTLVAPFLRFERVAVSSLVVFVILISAFLLYYPVHLRRNVIVYSIGYAFYFLTKAAGLFVSNVDVRWVAQIDTLRIAASTACLLFWMFMLNRKGEILTVSAAPHWRPEDEERLLSQLDSINTSLLRAGRK